MPLICCIELIILEPIRFNDCIILFPLQVVRRSRIGICISNSMSLHFWSNALYQILVAPYWDWDSIVSYSDSGFSVLHFPAYATVELHWSVSTVQRASLFRIASLHSAPSVSSSLHVYYQRLVCDCFFVGGRASLRVGWKTCQSRLSPFVIMHASLWPCHRSFYHKTLSPKRFV